ncbi:MAG: hypothetical protein ABIS47_12565 [Acidimicrobiales bacterium]
MAPAWPWSRTGRVRGEPGSANGASSFHLTWQLDDEEPLVEVAAVLEVVVPPSVDRLYFWALQASFLDEAGRDRGAGHVGLQWNGRHPDSRAVNWGGYAPIGQVLAGSPSTLPSTPGDPNTRDYGWESGRRYRLRIAPAPGPPGRWLGEVADLAAGRATVVRHLEAGGDRLGAPLVWSEVFARCEHPSVTVRWSGLEVVTASGRRLSPAGLTVSYEPGRAGGCDNTTVAADDVGVLQVTSTARTVSTGTSIGLRPGGLPG